MESTGEVMDEKKIQEGVRLILEGIGEDCTREGLLETPDRIARMYQEIFGGMGKDAKEHLSKTFHVKNNEMVVEKDIVFTLPVNIICFRFMERHMLPIFRMEKVVGLSKLARTVEVYAKRPQMQEQLTAQIADALMEHLKPQGAMVMIEAEHMCMTMRGIKKPGSRTVTYVTRGIFEKDTELQNRFFQMVR